MKNLALNIYFVATALIVVVVVAIVMNFLVKGAAVADEATVPDSITSNHKWFEQTYNDVLNMDRLILWRRVELQEIDKEKERELYYRKFKELSELGTIRENLASEYNAKRKTINRKMWKRELPMEIESSK